MSTLLPTQSVSGTDSPVDAGRLAHPAPLVSERTRDGPLTPAPDGPLTTEQLLGLFYHFDGIVQGKENLFVPIAFGLIPVTLLQWRTIGIIGTLAAGCVSVGLYEYHFLLLKRFGVTQDRIWDELGRRDAFFAEAVQVPKSLSIRIKRAELRALLIVSWVSLLSIKLFSFF